MGVRPLPWAPWGPSGHGHCRPWGPSPHCPDCSLQCRCCQTVRWFYLRCLRVLGDRGRVEAVGAGAWPVPGVRLCRVAQGAPPYLCLGFLQGSWVAVLYSSS